MSQNETFLGLNAKLTNDFLHELSLERDKENLVGKASADWRFFQRSITLIFEKENGNSVTFGTSCQPTKFPQNDIFVFPLHRMGID